MRGKLRKKAQAQDFWHASVDSVGHGDGDLQQPTVATCITFLQSCIRSKTLISGHIAHAHLIKSRHQHISVAATLILQLYLTCGAYTDAFRWFAHMPERNACSWNLIIGALVQQGHYTEALHHYQSMQQHGFSADQATYVHTLAACMNVDESYRLYADIRASGFDSDTIVGTALVSTFGRIHSLEDADLVFDRITMRNIVSWNAMISAYTQNGQCWKAPVLFNQSQQEGLLPDKVSVLNMLTAHAGNQESKGACKRLHLFAICGGFISDKLVGTALIYAYGSCSYVNEAILLFQEMLEKGVVSWNAMIRLYTQRGHIDDAFATFNQIQVEGMFPDSVTFVTLLDACARHTSLKLGKKIHLVVLHHVLAPDVVLTTALMNMYAKCGKLQRAHQLFINMQIRNVVSWNTIISAYTQHGHGKEALKLFHQMQHEAWIPNKVTFVEIFSACGCQAALSIGKRLHSCIVHGLVDMDDDVGSSLISMYGKCGNAKGALDAFGKLHTQNRSTWNAIIAAYAQLGAAKGAIGLFEKMNIDGMFADDITFVSILAACGRGGMLDEAFHYFVLMQKVHSLAHTAEHYDCMIDLLCRAGLFDHAACLIQSMPLEPTIISWTSLLCGYGIGVEG